MNTARKKVSPKKTKAKRSTDRTDRPGLRFGWDRSTLIPLAAIVAAVILMVAVIHFVKLFDDKRHFHWAEQRISYIENRLDAATGLKVSANWQNDCGNPSEQFFVSTERCEVSILAEYSVTSNAQAAATEGNIYRLVKAPQAFGPYVNGTAADAQPASANGLPNYPVPSENLSCDWSFDPESNRISDGARVLVDFTVSCSGPAAGNIY